jgi:hypothetical protein
MTKVRGKLQNPAKRAAPDRESSVQQPARPAQSFMVSHSREEDFKMNGLRTYARYRDLGTSKATHGLVQAHVIRLLPPFRREEVSKRHYHEVDFQMVYVLKGWIETELEGQGAITMKEGSCWIQPPRHRARGARLLGRLRGARNRPAGGFQDGRARVVSET